MPRNPSNVLWEQISGARVFILMAGPCVIESPELTSRIAKTLKKITARLPVIYIFKASYDKANRTSARSFRGPGVQKGLEILRRIRGETEVPIITDVHTESEAKRAAEVVDILQIPAFLCRQTDLIETAVATGKIVNIKKGQFLSPAEMEQVIAKARGFGGRKLMITERGTTFGYNNLVADMRSIPLMRRYGCPIIFDATHAVQLPGAGGNKSSGQGELAPVLARAAVAAGADGIFFETHPQPAKALSDGPNMIPLRDVPSLLRDLLAIQKIVRPQGRAR